MPVTKSGEQISWREFMSRWRKGIEGITAIQQYKAQLSGTYNSLAGIVFGIIVCLFGIKTLWWLMIILIGGLINMYVSYIGIKQKIKALQDIEDMLNESRVGEIR
jgi:membrane glycosyltransferase